MVGFSCRIYFARFQGGARNDLSYAAAARPVTGVVARLHATSGVWAGAGGSMSRPHGASPGLIEARADAN